MSASSLLHGLQIGDEIVECEGPKSRYMANAAQLLALDGCFYDEHLLNFPSAALIQPEIERIRPILRLFS
jgi:hypothetical protein